MSLRKQLKQSVEKCCTVAFPRACNNATNPAKSATLAATNHATNDGNTSSSAGFAATLYATTEQQAPKNDATTPQQHTVTHLQIGMIRSWLFKIGEPEADHFLVLDKCRSDPEAMEYFLKHAGGGFDD